MTGDIILKIREPDGTEQRYPSCMLQKGLLLFKKNKDLSEEGFGSGLPILKSGEKTIFPGSANIGLNEYADKIIVMVEYDLNMAETVVVKNKKIKNRALYKIKESLSFVHRNRLSGSGIAYSISPHIQDFAYDIKIGVKR